jgi:hypothetical protein
MTDRHAHVVCRDYIFEELVAPAMGAVEAGGHRAAENHRVAWDVVDA